MLSEIPQVLKTGNFAPELHLPHTAKLELCDFIASELPRWRDRPDRPMVSAEPALTAQLCAHLNGATRMSPIWHHLQFRTEVPDESMGGRSIDLAAQPLAAAIVIEQRRHTTFDMLFPIECKRLPTPGGKDRDEREYVITRSKTTGGMQRFKYGMHGAGHAFVAMLAYVQARSCGYWFECVNGWIRELADNVHDDWRTADYLRLLKDNKKAGVVMLASCHARQRGLPKCEMRHLWVNMNRGK